jgi:hypothetical protein
MLRDIRELLERGILIQNPSGGRSTSYRMAEPQNVRDRYGVGWYGHKRGLRVVSPSINSKCLESMVSY